MENFGMSWIPGVQRIPSRISRKQDSLSKMRKGSCDQEDQKGECIMAAGIIQIVILLSRQKPSTLKNVQNVAAIWWKRVTNCSVQQ